VRPTFCFPRVSVFSDLSLHLPCLGLGMTASVPASPRSQLSLLRPRQFCLGPCLSASKKTPWLHHRRTGSSFNRAMPGSETYTERQPSKPRGPDVGRLRYLNEPASHGPGHWMEQPRPSAGLRDNCLSPSPLERKMTWAPLTAAFHRVTVAVLTMSPLTCLLT